MTGGLLTDYVSCFGSFVMEGGCVKVGEGTGVNVQQGGSFEMNGGSVTDCKKGVEINAYGSFEMNGGSVTDCATGVVVLLDGRVSIHGASVSGNTDVNIKYDNIDYTAACYGFVMSPVEHGSVKMLFDRPFAVEGETIDLEITGHAAHGYEFAGLTVTDAAGNAVEIFEGEHDYAFLIKAVFEPIPAETQTASPTEMASPTVTASSTVTASPTVTALPTVTTSPTTSASPTKTVSPTVTASPTKTVSPTVTTSPTVTVSPTITTSPTVTVSPTVTTSPTMTISPTVTTSPTVTVSPTVTAAPTATAAPTDAPGPKPGTPISAGGAKYEVTGPGEVSFKGVEKSKAKVTVPDTIASDGVTLKVTAIADNAFLKDKKLKTITIGANVEVIGANAFKGCVKLTTLKGGAAVKEIGDNAFNGCKVLKKFPTLSELETIGAGAFKGCVKLTKFTLGEKVTSVGKSAFSGCKALKTITVQTQLLTTDNVGKAAFKGINKKATFKCPKAQLKAYKKLFVKKGAPKSCKFK